MNYDSAIPKLILDQLGDVAFLNYENVLRASCASHPPPFGMAWYGERYRSFAIDPVWMANSLIDNATKEAEGSRKLWELCGRIPDLDLAELVRLHAIDESRHARYYIVLLKLSFPEALDGFSRNNFMSLSPGYSKSSYPDRGVPSPMEVVWDEIIQMNIGEIRTYIHQLLMRPVLTFHCCPRNSARLLRILDRLREEEVGHIRYTANIIERLALRMPDFVASTMTKRMLEFNNITLTEVGS